MKSRSSSRFVVSPRAEGDLVDIWDYSADRWGAERADRYLREIQRAIEMAAADPLVGHPCDEVRVGYRKLPVASHVLFYRDHPVGIDVVRVLHQRMDFDRHL